MSAIRLVVFISFCVAVVVALSLSSNKHHYHDMGANKNLHQQMMAFDKSGGHVEHHTEVVKVSSGAESIALGEKIYFGKGSCMICHGEEGLGDVEQLAPRIGGLYSWYIEATLNKFKSKQRVNEKMDPYLETLSAEDFTNLANYISSL
ncbi:MAG: c-type cytochrome [Bacteriovoracaceae bacterium]|jgi:cytochrome c553|nr:c-type cytochrome [Bacteriovoracaceae bacterium]